VVHLCLKTAVEADDEGRHAEVKESVQLLAPEGLGTLLLVHHLHRQPLARQPHFHQLHLHVVVVVVAFTSQSVRS